MQRREFVIAGGGLLAGALPLAPALAAAPAGVKIVRAAAYAALVNQDFNVYATGRGVSMRLSALKELPAGPGQEQFTLTFSAADGVTLPSGSYDVEHAAIGLTPLYLENSVPGTYLAHFNLLL